MAGGQHNPFVTGETAGGRPSPAVLVIFGASGDLTSRKLAPALYNLACDNLLPEEFQVIGVSRSKFTDEDFRARVEEHVGSFSRRVLDRDSWERFSRNLSYLSLDAGSADDFEKLASVLQELDRERGVHNRVYYLATAPRFFSEIARRLASAGLVNDPRTEIQSTILVVEKPFGVDLRSAQSLNSDLLRSFAEEQIFRIDHYLGKETVQNILLFRFGNSLFEPLWNSRFIDHIQITVAEDVGVGSRAAYFDQVGLLRDIVQNHVLQMLALVCIEPPLSLGDGASIRDEKVKVLRSIRTFSEEVVKTISLRARYRSGYLNGDPVQGYLEEEGVPDSSSTETFLALRLDIDNLRWHSVPVFIRAGKRLPKRLTEISVHFQGAPAEFFESSGIAAPVPNVLSIRVQPREGISLVVNSKPPGPVLRSVPVEMDFHYGSSFGAPSPEAYERLLLDALRGDPSLFLRGDEIEESWRIVMPLLQAWSSDNPPTLEEYDAGSWGPTGSVRDPLLVSGRGWRRL